MNWSGPGAGGPEARPTGSPGTAAAVRAAAAAAATAAATAGAVPWQSLLRRLGPPWRQPQAQEALAVAGLTLAGGAAGTVVTVAAARLAAAALTGSAPPTRALLPRLVSGVAPIPVLGRYALGLTQYAHARALVGRGPAGATPPIRTAVATAVVTALLVAGHELTYRLLQHVLRAGTCEPPAPPPAPAHQNRNTAVDEPPTGFVVHFDGIGRFVPRPTPVGSRLADELQARLPDWRIVMSLMPGEVTQLPPWYRPVTGRLWRRLMRRSPTWLLARGIWEAVVAVDTRYRPALVAQHQRSVVQHLLAAGYERGGGTPVVFVCLSSGAQTALHSASETARRLAAPVDVVTFGGFADGTADLSGVGRVHAVVSWADPVEALPVLLLPSRWTAFGTGRWSRARRQRRVVVHRHGPATHVGRTGYLGPATIADGRTRVEQAADVVARAAQDLVARCRVNRDGLARR